MAAASLKRMLARLEARAERSRMARLQSAEAAVTIEQRYQRINDILDIADARCAEIDAALAGSDPKRRAWARKQLAAADTPEMRARCEQVTALIQACHADRDLTGGCGGNA